LLTSSPHCLRSKWESGTIHVAKGWLTERGATRELILVDQPVWLCSGCNTGPARAPLLSKAMCGPRKSDITSRAPIAWKLSAASGLAFSIASCRIRF
jgi:hypothetical protein